MPIDADRIAGDWVEVREDAAPGQILLRPSTADLPPARGRRRLDIAAGGHVQAGAPGPDDRTRRGPAAPWTLDGDVLTITSGEWQGAYRIIAADEEKLVLSPE